MFLKFWKQISLFFLLFLGALGLVFVSLLPVQQEKTKNDYTQTNLGKQSESRKPFVAMQPSVVLRENMQQNPQLKEIYDSIESYRQVASTLVMPDSNAAQEKEILENLFPQWYIDSLYKLQDVFIKIGWMKSEEKTALNTEAEVLGFLQKEIEIFIAQGAYPDPSDAERARYAAKVIYPKIWKAERAIYKRSSKQGAFYSPQKKPSGGALYEKQKANFLQYAYDLLMPKSALADLAIDSFVTIPDCWKSKDPTSNKGGSNIEFSPCCNCGCKIEGYYCNYVHDCGAPDEQRSNCDFFFGCLNSEILGCGPPDEHNAIYDGLPGYEVPATAGWGGGMNFDYSFICGCDK